MDNFTVLNQQARCDCCRDVADRVIAYTDSEYVNHICPSCVKDWATALSYAKGDLYHLGDGLAVKTCENPEAK